MSRICPRCQDEMSLYHWSDQRDPAAQAERPLAPSAAFAEKIEVDQCQRCGGIFFDAHEAEASIGMRDKLLELEGTRWLSMRCEHCQSPASQGETNCKVCNRPLGLACPACTGRMLLVRVLSVNLDVCTQCKAFWFDKDEHEKLRRRYESRYSSPDAPQKLVQPAKPAESATQKPSPLAPPEERVCKRCGKKDLLAGQYQKTTDGLWCAACFETTSTAPILDVAVPHESATQTVIDAIVTMAILDAVYDLFSSDH